jgi:hypothetical protein
VPWIASEDLREVCSCTYRLMHLFYTDHAPSQVCQEHICDLRLKLSATAKSSEFAHVDFAAVPDEDLMCVPCCALQLPDSCRVSRPCSYDCNGGRGETFAEVANRALRFVR